MDDAVQRSEFHTFGRLLQEHLRAPLYIPEEGRFALKALELAGPAGFVKELEHLVALGSPWASAALAHIYLRPGPGGQPDAARAIEICRRHAERGYAYAQYISAWALLHLGQRTHAVRTMQTAAISRFPPAAMDFAIFVWNGWGMKKRDSDATLKLVRVAIMLRHAMALKWMCRIYRSGQYGMCRRILGFVLMPVAVLRYVLAIRADPFAQNVLTLSLNNSPLSIAPPIEKEYEKNS